MIQKPMFSPEEKLFLWMRRLREIVVDQCLVLLSGPCTDQTHLHTLWIVLVTLYDQGCGFWPWAAALYLAGLCSETLNNISRQAPPGPLLNNSFEAVRESEWRWFRHLRASSATQGSPWNHKPAQVTLKFVAFRFLHSSGTKWSLNLVIYPTCPQVALLDLERGNYTSGLRGEEGEMWFWTQWMKDGSSDQVQSNIFLLSHTRKHNFAYRINIWFIQSMLKEKKIDLCLFLHELVVWCLEVRRDKMTAVSVPPVTMQLWGKHSVLLSPQSRFRPSSPLSLLHNQPSVLTLGGSRSFHPHYCENNSDSNTLSLWHTHV